MTKEMFMNWLKQYLLELPDNNANAALILEKMKEVETKALDYRQIRNYAHGFNALF